MTPSSIARRGLVVTTVATLVVLAGPLAAAEHEPPPDSGATARASTAAVWRAATRLGYYPTPELARAIAAHPGGAEGWALDELDRALAAAREPVRVPEALASFNRPLPELFAEFRRERDARRAVVGSAPAGEGTVRMAPPEPILRAVVRDGAAWRLAACADASVEHPLVARLTEFWFNHLNVFVGKGVVRPFAGHYVVHAIRPHVLGRFETLLAASARHPAMLYYLDQAQNVADGTPGTRGVARGINENYARELMELHTVGVEGGYTQQDVRELARILTGWTVDPTTESGFRFAPRLHDAGEKQLLGQRFGAGEQEGLRAIAMLAKHPATARRLARRLAEFFVADDPPPALVDRLAAAFSASAGDLRETMRALLRSAEFWDPVHRLFKTPFDFACSALAATGGADGVGAPARIGSALAFLAGAGQPVHGWPTPDGYRTDAATWISPEALTRRADLAFALARGEGADATAVGPFLGEATRERLARLPETTRAAAALASPDFMRK